MSSLRRELAVAQEAVREGEEREGALRRELAQAQAAAAEAAGSVEAATAGEWPTKHCRPGLDRSIRDSGIQILAAAPPPT